MQGEWLSGPANGLDIFSCRVCRDIFLGWKYFTYTKIVVRAYDTLAVRPHRPLPAARRRPRVTRPGHPGVSPPVSSPSSDRPYAPPPSFVSPPMPLSSARPATPSSSDPHTVCISVRPWLRVVPTQPPRASYADKIGRV